MKQQKIISSITLSALILSIVACGPKDKKAELAELKKQQIEINGKIESLEKELGQNKSDGSKDNMPTVTVSEIKPQPFSHYIEVQGVMESDENITVLAQSAGTVIRIDVKEGQYVNKNQILAEIDNAILKKTVDEVNAQLNFANTLFEKQKKLWEQNIGTEVQFLTAKNNKESLENKLATLNEQLDLSYIKSPINGIVDLIPVKKGNMVAPGTPTVRVVNFSNLKIRAKLAESYAPLIKKGSAIIAEIPDANAQIITKVSHVSRVIDPMSRSFVVEANVPKSNENYFPNMVIVMKIEDYFKKSALVIPITAVMQSMNDNYLFVISKEGDQDVVRKKMITLGKTYNGKVEILSGIAASEKVVVVGQQNLNDGDPVRY